MPAVRTRHLRGVPPLVSGSHLFDAASPEEYSTWIILGYDFRICRIQFLLWFDSGYMFLSVYVLVSSREEYEKLGFFGIQDFLYSALFGSTMDLCLRQVDMPVVMLDSFVQTVLGQGIMAGMDQKAHYMTRCRFFFATVACARLVLLFVYISRCVLYVLGRPRCSASWPV